MSRMRVWSLSVGAAFLVVSTTFAADIPTFADVRNGIHKAFTSTLDAIKSQDDAKIKESQALHLEILRDADFCERYASLVQKHLDLVLKELIKQKRNQDVETLASAAIEAFKTDQHFVAACQERKKMEPGQPFLTAEETKKAGALDADGVPNVPYIGSGIAKGMAILTDMIKSNNDARVQRAIAVLFDVYADDTVANKNRAVVFVRIADDWLRELTKQKRYADVEKVAVETMGKFPYNHNVMETMLERRILAKLEQGKPEEALMLAKSLYNVCSMSKTDRVIDLVCECLRGVHKDKNPEEAVKQFKLQQSLGASAPATEQAAAEAREKQTILKSIKVDVDPYQTAIAAAEKTFKDLDGLFAKGNLLLLADKPAEARVLFEQARKSATENDIAISVEGVARAMRAEDGYAGRANAWAKPLMPAAPAPKAAPAKR